MSEDVTQNDTIQEWSDQQLMAVGLLADIDTSKDFDTIADEVGVSRSTMYRWRQKPQFLAAVKELRDKNTRWAVTPVIEKLISLAKGGNTKAIKMFLQITSELGDGTNQTNVNFYPVRELTPKEIKAYNDEFEEEC